MDENKKISKGKIVEPIFDEPQYGIMAPPSEHEMGDSPEVAMMPAELEAEGLKLVPWFPMTRHYSELMEELKYFNNRGASLLRYLHYTTFSHGLSVRTQLTVPGVWEVGETAEYEVRVGNYITNFDLKDINVTLYVKDSGGTAKIISPPGTVLRLGNIDHSSFKSDTFRVEGVESGDVLFYLRIAGYIGSCKSYFHYDGKFWDGFSWRTRHPYLVKHHIH
jgi:hypothetical protein